jgi:hypothetical protein
LTPSRLLLAGVGGGLRLPLFDTGAQAVNDLPVKRAVGFCRHFAKRLMDLYRHPDIDSLCFLLHVTIIRHLDIILVAGYNVTKSVTRIHYGRH